MSLQKKIEEEMNDLALRIIRRAESSTDLKMKKMCSAYFDLKRLLEMANSVVKINTKTSKESGDTVVVYEP